MADLEARIRAMIEGVVPAVCLECLAGMTFLSDPIAQETAAGLVRAGHVVAAGGLCEACATRRPVFRSKVAGSVAAHPD